VRDTKAPVKFAIDANSHAVDVYGHLNGVDNISRILALHRKLRCGTRFSELLVK
jgi:hypothetical protein